MSFNDPFSVLFGNGGDSRRNNANNDDPIILDVEADGDGPARNTNAGPSGSSRPPRGPANPRITRKPASGGSGSSHGSKVLIRRGAGLGHHRRSVLRPVPIHHRSDVVRSSASSPVVWTQHG